MALPLLGTPSRREPTWVTLVLTQSPTFCGGSCGRLALEAVLWEALARAGAGWGPHAVNDPHKSAIAANPRRMHILRPLAHNSSDCADVESPRQSALAKALRLGRQFGALPNPAQPDVYIFRIFCAAGKQSRP